eukprot:7038041-Prymnesium_polylepis.1
MPSFSSESESSPMLAASRLRRHRALAAHQPWAPRASITGGPTRTQVRRSVEVATCRKAEDTHTTLVSSASAENGQKNESVRGTHSPACSRSIHSCTGLLGEEA